MNTLESTLLKDIILENPSAAAVLEKNKLDYCCKGNRTLKEACATQHLDATEIAQQLQQTISAANYKPAADFKQMTAAELINYILEEHHEYIKKVTPMLMTHVKKIAAVHGNRHPELLDISLKTMVLLGDLFDHLNKEEQILFPYILSLEKKQYAQPQFVSVKDPIKIMMNEHDEAGELMAEINKLSNQYTPPADACTTYKLTFSELEEFERKLHEHVHLENYLLFPMAEKLEQE